MKNQFEQHIKQALERFEAEYNPADWSDLQSRLNKAKAGKSSSIGKTLLVAASVIATAGAVYYFSTTDKVNNVTADNSPAQDKNIVVRNETPVEQNEVKDKQLGNNEPARNNVEKEVPVVNNTPEKETIAPEKSDAQTIVKNIENKVPVQEPVQAPVEPSSNIPALSASFRADSKVCEGDAVLFTPERADASLTYKWYFDDGESSAEQNPKHIFAEAGTYTVKLRVTSLKDKKHAEQKNSIQVVAAPSVRINYSPSDDNNLLVNFQADADKVTDWKWDFGDKQTASVQNPAHTYRKSGNYKVSVTAKNSTGCSAVVVKEVNLKLDLLAPTAFTPDGNGINDTWMPIALLNGNYIFTLTIADKTGNVVFETSDKNRAWDGQNGKTGDTFIWTAVVKEKNGEETNYQGLITISQ